jgi:hypothetical protein
MLRLHPPFARVDDIGGVVAASCLSTTMNAITEDGTKGSSDDLLPAPPFSTTATTRP